jgi:hypothetical protein
MRISCHAWTAFAALSLGIACTGASPNPGGNGGGAGMVATGGGANPGGSSSHSGGGTATGAGGTTSGITCGTKVCGTGQYCCNASCSMCAPMGAACIQIACSTTGGAGNTQCSSAADCRLFDDYCGGCNCRALLQSAPDPTCSGTTSSCLIAPCAVNPNYHPVCTNGQCVVGG